MARIQHNYLKETDLQFHFFLERHRGKLDKEFKENRGRLRHSHKREDQRLINVKKEKKKEKKKTSEDVGNNTSRFNALNCAKLSKSSVERRFSLKEYGYRRSCVKKNSHFQDKQRRAWCI